MPARVLMRRRGRFSAWLLVAFVLIAFLMPLPSFACTLWGAVGEDVGSGTITAKNRDWKPDHVQVLQMRRDRRYAYFGLYAEGNKKPGLKEGVNEKGLGVVSATAGSIPESKRQIQKGRPGLMTTLLADYASCDEVLADSEKLFSNRKPQFLLISDARQIITLEIGMNGHFSATATTSGIVAHTNHYLGESLLQCNGKIGKSSASRLQRINDLLCSASRPLTSAAFTTMSRDRHDGIDNSIWRTGKGSCTLSSWIMQCVPGEPTRLQIVIANPGKAEKVESFVLDDKFWKNPPAIIEVLKASLPLPANGSLENSSVVVP